MKQAKKKKSKYAFNPNINTWICILVGAALLILCIILILHGCDSTPPEASASPSAQGTLGTLIPDASGTAPLNPTEPLSPSSEATDSQAPDPSAGTASPSPDTTLQPLSVSENEVAALHITLDTGFENVQNEAQAFDDFYKLLGDTDSIDLEDIRLIVYLTDYRGNIRAYRFSSMDAIVRLPGFRFSANANIEIEQAAEIKLFIDRADNAHVTWASQTAKVVSSTEAGTDTVLTYQHSAGTIKLTIRNIGLLQKDELLG
ncbi:MAG: hypothetical protein KH354_04665 [Clostridiales bacterium]|nr:hypothetical protein [Clostridiales bacterium]